MKLNGVEIPSGAFVLFFEIMYKILLQNSSFVKYILKFKTRVPTLAQDFCYVILII